VGAAGRPSAHRLGAVSRTVPSRHAFIVLFTILTLFFLCQRRIAGGTLQAIAAHSIGEQSEVTSTSRHGHLSLGEQHIGGGTIRRIRNLGAYVISGSVPPSGPQSPACRARPFLGYAIIGALSLRVAMTGAAAPAVVSFALGCLILFCGDKICAR
jgi:hypothetical protein